MRLVDFLIFLLEAHAQTLQRLAALLGEDELLRVLEDAGEILDESDEKDVLPQRIKTSWFEAATSDSRGKSPYSELEWAVREFHLPSIFEFHLWAYPHYRAYIESGLELDAKIKSADASGMALIDEAMAQAQAWARLLPVTPAQGRAVESAAHVPWLKFRAAVLKRIGRRPLGPVY
jgi:hypothetical protein